MTDCRKRAAWLAEPLPNDVDRALRRLESTGGVAAVAVMPDVHLAKDVCIGTVTATRGPLLPNAVGGDIGCGMQAVAFDVDAASVDRAEVAAAILSHLYESVPILRHPKGAASPLPPSLEKRPLSASRLEARRRREAGLQFGTVGRGNHFVELQRAEDGQLWVMVHTGSRGMGQAIREHYLRLCEADLVTGIRYLPAGEPAGRDYLRDGEWARRYAAENRTRIVHQVAEVLRGVVGARRIDSTQIDADHNHVQRETHFGQQLWVHRKGAQAAGEGEIGIIPGSMGTASFHVTGRGHRESLASSSHGAGRAMSRIEARRRISRKQLARDTEGVWYDHRLREKLREEAPGAYKGIGAVMRAQQDLVRVVRRLRPLLVYKGV